LAQVISTTTSAGITLSNQSYNPVTIAGGSRISKTSGSNGALYGKGGATNSWTIDNFGQILGGSAVGGVYLGSFAYHIINGVLVNESGGTITGNRYAVAVAGPGSVTNKSGAVISAVGSAGVYLRGQGIVNNYGTIIDSGGSGVYERGGGTVFNGPSGTISGSSVGVVLTSVGTIINAGLIAGGKSYAVLFAAGSNANRLIVDPGSLISGRIKGGGGVLELAAGTGSGGGPNIITTAGITNFGTLQLDAGAQWTMTGASNSMLGSVSITGFTTGNTIDLLSFSAVSKTFANNALVLTDGANAQVTLNLQGSFTTGSFQVTSDKNGGTNVTNNPTPRTYSWAGSGTIDWNTPTAWDLGAVPTSVDSAIISNTGNNTVTIASTATVSISQLTIAGADTLLVAGKLIAQSITDSAVLAFTSGRTLNSTPVRLSGTISERGGGTLTIGSSEVITQTGSLATLNSTTGGGESILNQGTIKAALAGASLAIVPLNFTNKGTISVTDETVTIGYDAGSVHGSWSNAGLIALSGTASLVLDGSLATAGIGTITGANGVTVAGILNNTGTTLNVGNGTSLGLINLANGGLINGGTISDHGNGFSFNRNGTFNAVIYQGTLNIATGNGRLNVTNGLTVTGTSGTGAGFINLTQGNDAQLNFIGSQTVDNATINLSGTDATNPLTEIDIGGGGGLQLTLGKNLTVLSTAAKAQAAISNTTSQDSASVVNLGTIVAAAAGGSFNITPNNGFTNNGTIQVNNGETVAIGPGLGTFTNGTSGVISVSGGSELEIFYNGITAQMNNPGTITLANGATLNLASGLFTQTALGNIVNQGATTLFAGEFDGKTGTIALGAGTKFNKVLLSGSLHDAVLQSNSSFSVVPGNASLRNVVFQGPLNVATDFTNLTINQGVTLEDVSGSLAGTINVTGQADNLIFVNQAPVSNATGQSLNNVTLNIGNASGADVISPSFSAGTFAIGSGATIVSATPQAQAILNAGSGTTVDFHGTLAAIAQSGTFTVTGVPSGASQSFFSNNGLMLVGNGDTLSIGLTITGAAGTIDIGTGGVADISGAVVAGQTLGFTDVTGLLRLHQPASVAATIAGFVQGDTIDLAGITASTAVWSANKLTISNSGSTVAILTMPGNYTKKAFVVGSDKAGGSQVTITATCFGAGTHILTTRGDIAVERLHKQDFVLTASGMKQPIVWIGRRHVDFRRHSNKLRVLPVHVAAHAFGPQRPKRTLLLSPDHAVYVDDVLIPIRYLINRTSVVQIECDAITYYHVELPRHDVLLAEGLPTESYLDAGARRAFANCDGIIQLDPDFAPPLDDHGALWDAKGYAPLIVTGELLQRVRRRLDSNAGVWRHAA
jgi:hypothetical protein